MGWSSDPTSVTSVEAGSKVCNLELAAVDLDHLAVHSREK